MMKRIALTLLVIIMLMALATPALAEDIAHTQDTTVSITLDPTAETYTLVIPATVEIDPVKKRGEIKVELSDVNLTWSSNLFVFAIPANHDTENGGSYLVHTEDPTKKIHYTLRETANGVILGSDTKHLEVAHYYYSGDFLSTDSGSIIMTIDGDYPGGGTYTDTITFSVLLNRDMY